MLSAHGVPCHRTPRCREAQLDRKQSGYFHHKQFLHLSLIGCMQSNLKMFQGSSFSHRIQYMTLKIDLVLFFCYGRTNFTFVLMEYMASNLIRVDLQLKKLQRSWWAERTVQLLLLFHSMSLCCQVLSLVNFLQQHSSASSKSFGCKIKIEEEKGSDVWIIL